jgi:hypothetical protein
MVVGQYATPATLTPWVWLHMTALRVHSLVIIEPTVLFGAQHVPSGQCQHFTTCSGSVLYQAVIWS